MKIISSNLVIARMAWIALFALQTNAWAGKASLSGSLSAGNSTDAASAQSCSAACPSDLNLDSVVDEKDQYLLKGVWGPVPPASSKVHAIAVCAAAISGDKSSVDGADLAILLGAYGKCSSGSAQSAESAAKQ